MKTFPHAMRGMTLIELMIVVVIVAVLASIGVPSYRQYVLRATRTEAKTALLRVQAAQEKFYLQNNRYASGAELTNAPPNGLGLSQKSENGNYTLAIANDDTGLGSQGYKATAIPADGSGQKKDTPCQLFRIDHTGNRFPAITDAAPCWR